jgi:ribosomal protein S18 acetylase RimI-like enzyme
MKIVKASIEYIDLLVPLFDAYRVFYNQEPDREGARKFLTGRINNNESVIFAAMKEEDGEHIAMGFTQLYPSFSSVSMKKAWILNDLFVAESFRNAGAAEALLKAAEEFGRGTSARYLMLETQISNTPAQNLYEKLGWKRDEEHFYYYLPL